MVNLQQILTRNLEHSTKERGFEPPMILCKEIWALVRYHRWECFCVTEKENIIIPIVQEFYASFRDQESRRPFDNEIWENVTINGKKEIHDTSTGTNEVHSSSLSRPNSKLPVSREDPVEILIGFITRARSKKFKNAMMGLIQHVWAKHEMSNPYWTQNNVPSPGNVLHVASHLRSKDQESDEWEKSDDEEYEEGEDEME
ncbi:hypothetical protein Golax_020570 [Gossypium laxum]|uniref:Uncharacterized protein n=1 Tax=Gossypium laxum TaxID=34288 RepID=A0A7J9AZ74_9ROSI|nr:hypothetical protein [Gossypium laxum]